MAAAYRKVRPYGAGLARLQDTVEIDPGGGLGGGPMEGVAEPQNPQQNTQSSTTENPVPGQPEPRSTASSFDFASGIEAELLAIEAIDQIATDVAARVRATTTGLTGIVIADRQFVSAFQMHRALSAQVTLLEQAIGSTSDATAALALGPLVATAKTLFGGLGKLGAGFGALEPYLRTQVSRTGRKFTLRTELLEAAVAGRLADFEVSLPRLGTGSSDAGSRLIDRILRLAAQSKPVDETDPGFAVHKSLELLLAQLFAKPADPGAPTLADQLVAADQVALSSAKAMLVLDLALAGGSYRLRDSWWRSSSASTG